MQDIYVMDASRYVLPFFEKMLDRFICHGMRWIGRYFLLHDISAAKRR